MKVVDIKNISKEYVGRIPEGNFVRYIGLIEPSEGIRYNVSEDSHNVSSPTFSSSLDVIASKIPIIFDDGEEVLIFQEISEEIKKRINEYGRLESILTKIEPLEPHELKRLVNAYELMKATYRNAETFYEER